MSKFARGVVITLVGASLWGLSGACSQFLFSNYDITPLFLVMFRMLGAGLAFLAVSAVCYRDALVGIFTNSTWRRQLLVFGVGGLFACQLSYLVTVSYTNAGTATVLQALNVVFVLLATCLMARRWPRTFEVLGLVAAFIATVLLATKGDLRSLNLPAAGLAWGLITAATSAFYVMSPTRLFERWGSFVVTGMGMLSGGIAALVVWLCAGAAGLGGGLSLPTLDGVGVLALLAVTFIGTFAAFGCYLNGVSLVGGMRGSLLGTAEPVSAMLLSAFWLNTPFAATDWVAMLLMVATIFLVTLSKRSEKPAR